MLSVSFKLSLNMPCSLPIYVDDLVGTMSCVHKMREFNWKEMQVAGAL